MRYKKASLHIDGTWTEFSHEMLEDLVIELWPHGGGSFKFGDQDDYYFNPSEFNAEELPHVIELLEEFLEDAKKIIEGGA